MRAYHRGESQRTHARTPPLIRTIGQSVIRGQQTERSYYEQLILVKINYIVTWYALLIAIHGHRKTDEVSIQTVIHCCSSHVAAGSRAAKQ